MATGVTNDYFVQATAPSAPDTSEPVDDYDPHTKYPNTSTHKTSFKHFISFF